jgi:acetyl-CoA C-acetyltransferase
MALGIKDKVAVLGMGCSTFGERWDARGAELMGAAGLHNLGTPPYPGIAAASILGLR